MKNRPTYLITCCIAAFAALSVTAFPAHAEEISIKTDVSFSHFEVGQPFDVTILLNLGIAVSIGGYIDVTYNPAALRCVTVVNHDLFGQRTYKYEACPTPDTGKIRLTSFTSSSADVRTFAAPQSFGAITFQALQPTAATAIRFADTSQIFGNRGGDILTLRDDHLTASLTISEVSTPTPTMTPELPTPTPTMTPELPTPTPTMTPNPPTPTPTMTPEPPTPTPTMTPEPPTPTPTLTPMPTIKPPNFPPNIIVGPIPEPTPVPEPTTLLLFGAGLLFLCRWLLRKKRTL